MQVLPRPMNPETNNSIDDVNIERKITGATPQTLWQLSLPYNKTNNLINLTFQFFKLRLQTSMNPLPEMFTREINQNWHWSSLNLCNHKQTYQNQTPFSIKPKLMPNVISSDKPILIKPSLGQIKSDQTTYNQTRPDEAATKALEAWTNSIMQRRNYVFYASSDEAVFQWTPRENTPLTM